MRYILSIFLFASLASCVDISQNQLDETEKIIASIQSEFISDKRLALFDVVPEKFNKSILIKGETTIPAAYDELIKKLNAVSISYIDSVSILPSSRLNGKIHGVVNLSVCNIRSRPKHSAELATQALMGTPLKVYKKQGDFYYIQTPDNYLGWLDDGGLQLMDEKQYQDWQVSDKAVCTRDFSYVYEKAEKNSPKVSDLVAGNILRVQETKGGFAKIILPDGRAGYMKTDDLLPYQNWLKTGYPTQESIIATAKEFMGRPYLWGGTSGKGMDCSGYTKTVYFLNGIQLERDASLQVHTGELVETDTTWKNLEAGDLLFFGRKATPNKKERISHVAIYLGDGKIIHASDRVKIESLKRGDPDFAEHRVQSFIRAKRAIGSEGKNGIIALKDSPFYNFQND